MAQITEVKKCNILMNTLLSLQMYLYTVSTS